MHAFPTTRAKSSAFRLTVNKDTLQTRGFVCWTLNVITFEILLAVCVKELERRNENL